jgi:intracellular septation protein A
MINVLRLLLADFLSTLVFVAIAAVATGMAQLLSCLLRQRPIDAMQWLGVLLTLVFGTATIALHDPRFIMAKPSIIYFALGAVMLRRGWLARYLPEHVVHILPPSLIIGAGRAWAMLMFGLGVTNLVVALTLPLWVWTWFISIGALGAKLVMLLGQYVLFRRIARGIIRQRNAIVVTV